MQRIFEVDEADQREVNKEKTKKLRSTFKTMKDRQILKRKRHLLRKFDVDCDVNDPTSMKKLVAAVQKQEEIEEKEREK